MVFPYPGVYENNGGFSPPLMGGTNADQYYAFTYATTAAQTIFTLLPGVTIVDFNLTVSVAFNNSATLSIGGNASATTYLNAATIGTTTGKVTITAFDTTQWWTPITSGDTLTLTLGGGPSTGAGVISVRYIML